MKIGNTEIPDSAVVKENYKPKKMSKKDADWLAKNYNGMANQKSENEKMRDWLKGNDE